VICFRVIWNSKLFRLKIKKRHKIWIEFINHLLGSKSQAKLSMMILFSKLLMKWNKKAAWLEKVKTLMSKQTKSQTLNSIEKDKMRVAFIQTMTVILTQNPLLPILTIMQLLTCRCFDQMTPQRCFEETNEWKVQKHHATHLLILAKFYLKITVFLCCMKKWC